MEVDVEFIGGDFCVFLMFDYDGVDVRFGDDRYRVYVR